MKNDNRVLDVFFILFVSFLSIFAIFLVFGSLISNIIVSSETLFMPFQTFLPNSQNVDYFWKMFLSSDHSWFFASFVLHLFSRVLPLVMNTNPQDFYLSYGWIAFFIIFCVFSYILIFNVSKYFKSRLAPIFIFWLIFPFIIYNFKSAGFIWALYNDTWFVCYIFNSIFPLLLFQILEKYYVTQKWFFFSPNKENVVTNKFVHYLKIFFVILLVFLTGIGHELYKFVFLGTLILGLWFHKSFVKTKINYKSYISFIIVAVIMNCFVFLIPTFHDWFSSNVREFSVLASVMMTNNAFFDYVIGGNIFKLIFIPLLLVYSYFAVEDKEQVKRLAVSVISSYISLLIFNYLIIFLTDCNLDISQHYGIRFLTKTVLLSLLFSVVGFVIAKSSEKFKKITFGSFVIFFVTLCPWFLFDGISKFQSYYKESEYAVENQYLIERFYDLYGKKNNVIYVTYTNSGFCELSSYYFKYWYGGNKNVPFKIEYVCKEGDSCEVCQQKLIKKIYEKTHFRVYEDDLSEFEFSDISSYKKIKSQGKFKLKFF